ncbi:GntR family transcriptional regulator [Diaphorobacter sp. HDW4A]|nr:GntR family transcriptional regulator [Diaphorobacter sp. HDW4A]
MNLSNVSAQEEAYQYLLNAIRMGTLQPGSRIIAEDIATELDMSRMPIREALRRLSAEGLISLRTNRGAVVKKLSREEVCEIFEMRAVLEGLAASMAVKNATASDIKELELLLARLRAVQNDLPLWITAHREFHEKISALSRAPRILAQITSLHALIEPLMRVWIESSPESKNVNSVHERILEVMKSGDATEMEKLIKKHSRVTAEVILKSMF